MAEIVKDGRRIPIPDGTYTGLELQNNAGVEKTAMPVLRRGGKDIPVGPSETISLEPGDSITFHTPMETAHGIHQSGDKIVILITQKGMA
jgi:hypothetical protein